MDAFAVARAVSGSDEVSLPGVTWCTRTAEEDRKDHHDRIDFVMVGTLSALVRIIRLLRARTYTYELY